MSCVVAMGVFFANTGERFCEVARRPTGLTGAQNDDSLIGGENSLLSEPDRSGFLLRFKNVTFRGQLLACPLEPMCRRSCLAPLGSLGGRVAILSAPVLVESRKPPTRSLRFARLPRRPCVHSLGAGLVFSFHVVHVAQSTKILEDSLVKF